MSRPVWITPSGNLGTFPEAEFYSLPLEVNNPTGSPVTFIFLSGTLPPGLQVVNSGILQGVPVVTDPGPEDETRTYKFTIRASCQTPVVVVDRTFNFTVSNIVPPQITPETTLIGEYFDGTPIEHKFQALEVNREGNLIWSLKSDAESLPPGLVLTEDGYLRGFIGRVLDEDTSGRLGYNAQPTQVPTAFTPTANTSVPSSQTFAGNSNPYSLVTTEPFGYTQQYEEFPYDFTTATSLNKNYTFTVQVFDGANYDTQTYTIKVIAKGSWSTDNDINTVDDNFITVDADQVYSPIVTTTVSSLPVVRQNSNFSFRFSAVDFYGTSLTWDSDIKRLLPNLSIDTSTGWLSGHIDTQIDYRKVYTFYVTAANTVPQYNLITANYIAGGVSPNTNVIVSNTAGIRPGMEITGNGFGTGQQVYRVYTENNTISITSSANSTPSGNLTFSGNLVSEPMVYSLTVLGDVNNQIVWDTPTIAGNIINGGVSELSIVAHNSLGKEVAYQLVHGTLNDGSAATGTEYLTATTVSLPQGLQLLSSGRITGRTTFRHFQLDAGATTIDGGRTKFDNIHTFTVKATAVDNSVADTKTFKLRINNLYTKPYENLYMQALPPIEQRRLLTNILADPSLFPTDSIYRHDDPNFGKASTYRFLELPGVDPSTLSSYISAIQKNHYNKVINFGPVKTAIATDPDNDYAVKYEVVYVEVVDPFNPENLDVKLETNLSGGINHVANPYYDPQGTGHYIINPNTFDNMETRISQNLGYSAQGVIPDWMTSVQEDKSVLGFKRALVLAYTNPGESKKIAYRMQDRGIELAGTNYTVDRYLVDNTLSNYYDITNQAFLPSRETTFDYLSQNDVYYYSYVSGGVTGYSLTLTSTVGLSTGMIITGNGFTDGQTIVSVDSDTTITISSLAWGQTPSGAIKFSKPVYTVNYAVTQPFASINNKSVQYILDNGGIDNVGGFKTGDRLIFAQQEEFNTNYPNDGWIYYTDLYLGNYSDINDTVDISYYDSTGYDSSYVVPGYSEYSIDAKEPILLAPVAVGTTNIYIPYSAVDYIGKTIVPSSFVDYNTTVIGQSVTSGVGTGLSLKLTLSKPTVGTGSINNIVKLTSYLTVTAVDYTNNTITVNTGTLPVDIADRLKLIENVVAGYGIPSGIRIARIVNNVITLESYTPFTVSIRIGDYLGYYVQNQRAGIWEIQIDPDTENVRLEFVQSVPLRSRVKVLDGRSYGQSFLLYKDWGDTTDPDYDSYTYDPTIPFTNIDATVPMYRRIPSTVTFNGNSGNRTRFDGGGTKFFDLRDSPAEAIVSAPTAWVEAVAYDINSKVLYQGYYYKAITPVLPSRTFQTGYWEKYEVLPVSGDKYIKFPKIGVFN